MGPSDFGEGLRSAVDRCREAGAPVAQLNVADATVAPAAALRQVALDPQPEALLRITTPDPDDVHRQVEAALPRSSGIDRTAAYVVRTREPLADEAAVGQPGARTRGFAQLALLRRSPELDVGAFHTRWLDMHTTVALETQSTFRYVQHLVVRSLSDDAPQLDGIVEECFPTAAMTDPHVFFATGGDADVLDARITAMVASVSSFLDLGVLDVIPTSEYRFDR